MLPVNEVSGATVPPVHIPPSRPVGIVLIVEVIDAILVDHPIGVVHPAIGGAVVVDRAVIVLLRRIKAVGELELLPGDGLGRETYDLDGVGILAPRDRDGHEVVYAVDGKTEVHLDLFVLLPEKHYCCLSLVFLDRCEEVVLVPLELNQSSRIIGVQDLHRLGGSALASYDN